MNKTLRAFYAFNGISLGKFMGRMFVLIPALIITAFSCMNLFLHDAGSSFYTAMTVSTVTPFLMLAGTRQCISDETAASGNCFRSMVDAEKQFVRQFRFQWLLGWMNVVWCIVLYYLASNWLLHAENSVTFDRMIFTAAQMTVVAACMPFCLLAVPVYAELAVYIGMFALISVPSAVFLNPSSRDIIALLGIAVILAFSADKVWMRAAARNLAAGSEETVK